MKIIIYSPKGIPLNDFDCENVLDEFIDNDLSELKISNDKVVYHFIRYVKVGIVNPKDYKVFVYDTELIELQFDESNDLITRFDFFYDKYSDFVTNSIFNNLKK